MQNFTKQRRRRIIAFVTYRAGGARHLRQLP